MSTTQTNNEHLEAIQDIRKLMNKSTRFLSLSGLSGVFAGVYALIGAYFGLQYYKDHFTQEQDWSIYSADEWNQMVYAANRFFIIDMAIVLVLSLLTAYIFSARKARKEGHNMFDAVAIRMMVNLFIPVLAGGLFCIAMFLQDNYLYIAPAMLMFYGMGLLNASKYTLDDIRYLGICEIALGLIAAFYPGNGIYYWIIGFGVLHIIYGLSMYLKYERK